MTSDCRSEDQGSIPCRSVRQKANKNGNVIPGKDTMLSIFTLRDHMNNSYEMLSERENLGRLFVMCPYSEDYHINYGKRPW